MASGWLFFGWRFWLVPVVLAGWLVGFWLAVWLAFGWFGWLFGWLLAGPQRRCVLWLSKNMSVACLLPLQVSDPCNGFKGRSKHKVLHIDKK